MIPARSEWNLLDCVYIRAHRSTQFDFNCLYMDVYMFVSYSFYIYIYIHVIKGIPVIWYIHHVGPICPIYGMLFVSPTHGFTPGHGATTMRWKSSLSKTNPRWPSGNLIWRDERKPRSWRFLVPTYVRLFNGWDTQHVAHQPMGHHLLITIYTCRYMLHTLMNVNTWLQSHCVLLFDGLGGSP
jgi:hypothetical protein